MRKSFLVFVIIFSFLSLPQAKGMDSLWTAQGHTGAIKFIRYSNDGKYIFTFGDDYSFKKWDANNGQLIFEQPLFIRGKIDNSYMFTSFTLSNDELTYLISEEQDGALELTLKVKIFNLNNDSLISTNLIFYSDVCMGGQWRFSSSNPSYNNDDSTLYVAYRYNWSCPGGGVGGAGGVEGLLAKWKKVNDSLTWQILSNEPVIDYLYSPDKKYFVLSSLSEYYYGNGQHPASYRTNTQQIVIQDSSFKNSKILYNNNYDSRVQNSIDTWTHIVRFSNNSKYFSYNIMKIGMAEFEIHHYNLNSQSDNKWVLNYNKGFAGLDDFAFDKSDKYIIVGAPSSSPEMRTKLRIMHFDSGLTIDSLEFIERDYNWHISVSPDSLHFATGSYEGILRVFGSQYLADSLNALFGADKQTGDGPLQVKFYDLSTGKPDSLLWDFGDGTTSTEQNPIHIYNLNQNIKKDNNKPLLSNASSSFTVKLTAYKYDKFKTSTKVNYIIINEPTAIREIQENKLKINVSPNPFNDFTNINYTLSEPSFVRLTISDIFGNEIAVPVNGFQEAGEKRIQFDGSLFSPGVYFYRLQAGTGIFSGKIIVVR